MTDEQLIEELYKATRGLTFMSESDYGFDTVIWGLEPTPELLRLDAGQGESAPIETRTAAEFFRVAASEAEWKGAEERATARRFQALLQLLEQNLSDLKVFRVGTISIPVYIVGRRESGKWLGVSTRVVET